MSTHCGTGCNQWSSIFDNCPSRSDIPKVCEMTKPFADTIYRRLTTFHESTPSATSIGTSLLGISASGRKLISLARDSRNRTLSIQSAQSGRSALYVDGMFGGVTLRHTASNCGMSCPLMCPSLFMYMKEEEFSGVFDLTTTCLYDILCRPFGYGPCTSKMFPFRMRPFRANAINSAT